MDALAGHAAVLRFCGDKQQGSLALNIEGALCCTSNAASAVGSNLSREKNHARIVSRKVAAVTDKTILYDLPGIGCKATARWVEGQCCIAEPDTALLIQVLIAKTKQRRDWH